MLDRIRNPDQIKKLPNCCAKGFAIDIVDANSVIIFSGDPDGNGVIISEFNTNGQDEGILSIDTITTKFSDDHILPKFHITKTCDNKYLLATTIEKTSGGNSEIFLAKYDPESNTCDWTERDIFDNQTLEIQDIVETSDGGFLMAGSSRSSDGNIDNNQGQNDAWIVKVNANGQLVWQKTFGGSEIDFGYDAVELQDGSTILVGESSSSKGDLSENQGFADLLIVKINP